MQTVVNRVLQYIRDLIENFLRGGRIGNNYPKIAAISGHQIGFAKGIPQRIRYGDELLERAKRIAAMTPNVPQTDSVELLREDRDR